MASNAQKTNAKGDTCFYGDWDEKSGMYVVFGDNSGFGYASYATQQQADAKAIELDKQLAERF